MPNRKEVLKMLSVMPLGLAAGRKLSKAEGNFDSVLKSNGAMRGPEIFRSIGVEPVINCRGTFTIIGGSLERPEVREAMEAAAHNFVQYDELAEGIGRRLAELTGAEWGMVSAGCAAAMKHATAACVTGGNPEKLIRIPDLTGFDKTEVIIPRHSRNAYDHSVRNIGVDVITVENAEELENAFSSRTAMVYLLAGRTGPMGTKSVSKLAKSYDVPVLVDAAAEDLTIPNAHLQDGATMVCYSGGKAIRGPQCAGLLLGPKDLLMSAWQASSPHHGPGRDNKVGREEMIGMLAAVEAWVETDHRAEWDQWVSWLEHIEGQVSKVKGVETSIDLNSDSDVEHPGDPAAISNHSPVLRIYWDPDKLHITGQELAEILARTSPRIVVGGGNGPEPGTTGITVTAWMMQPGNDQVVAERVSELLSERRKAKPADMTAPAAELTGRWKLSMEYFSSQSEHTVFIEVQDSNWIEGSHKGDFSIRDIAGTIEGNEVKLLSRYRVPGNGITNIFTGTLSEDGNTISGEVFLGEYLNAKFTATRHEHSGDRDPIRVPGGAPLAT